jgi:hypothetical protein
VMDIMGSKRKKDMVGYIEEYSEDWEDELDEAISGSKPVELADWESVRKLAKDNLRKKLQSLPRINQYQTLQLSG